MPKPYKSLMSLLMMHDLQRFWSKVEKTDYCWNWIAAKDKRGYGRFNMSGRIVFAHRISYENFKGKISDGLTLDHLCKNPGCVNPDHLEAVSHKENVLRGNVGVHQLSKTHCPKGHPYSGDNLMICANNRRRCRICNKKRIKISS